MSKQAEIKIPLGVLEKQLLEKLNNVPYAKLISKVIISNLEPTERGISQLFMAFMGMEDTTPWLVGDEALIAPKDIHSWVCEKNEMIERKISIHKGKFKVTIKNIDMNRTDNIYITFLGLYGTLYEEKQIEQWVKADELIFDLDLNCSARDVGDEV